MWADSRQWEKIKLKDVEPGDIQCFAYLRSIAKSERGAVEDVKSRIGRAKQACNTLRLAWNSTSILKKNTL